MVHNLAVADLKDIEMIHRLFLVIAMYCQTKLGNLWVMTSVRVQFVLIFAVVQLCTAEYVL